MLKQRSVGVSIILSIITCGIYGIYWWACVANDLNYTSGRRNETSGAGVVLLSIVTCGIYGVYWSYTAGKKLYEAQNRYNLYATDNSVLFLVLALFGFEIINLAIIQNELNKMNTNVQSDF